VHTPGLHVGLAFLFALNLQLITEYLDLFSYFFGYPTDCARIIFCVAFSFNAFPSASRSTDALTTVASPSDAQYKYTFWR